jgi:capsular polysaccharide biosynthesis protein
LLYSYPWLVNSDLRSYQNEFIQLLGQRPEQLVKVGRHAVASCKRLLVPALHTSDQAIGRGVQWMRERFAHLLAAPAQATHRLLVSRRDVTRRSLLNEDELFEALAPLGFVRIVPGELSVVQQIAAFSSARIIVAAHGAALTNMLFAPRETAIVELTSTAIEHMSLFRKLARTTQQPIVTITSDDYPLVAGEIEINTPFRIDTRRVVRAVEDLI